MILARHDFEHDGRLFSAELRIIGFSLNAAPADHLRWVVFDDSVSHQWTLPGEGMITDSAEDVKLRFGDHLARTGNPFT